MLFMPAAFRYLIANHLIFLSFALAEYRKKFQEVDHEVDPAAGVEGDVLVLSGGVTQCVRECLLREDQCVALSYIKLNEGKSVKCRIFQQMDYPVVLTEEATFLGAHSPDIRNSAKPLISGSTYSVPDSALTASSSCCPGQGSSRYPRCSKYVKPASCDGAWLAGTGDTSQWIQVDLGKTFYVYSVGTKGRESDWALYWVTTYKVATNDGTLQVYTQGGNETIFTGNSDKSTEVINQLDPPIVGRNIRVNPMSWYANDGDFPALRWEIYGHIKNA